MVVNGVNNTASSFLTLTHLLHVKKELQQHFSNEKKPESRWNLVIDQAIRKQVGNSAHTL